LSSEETVTEMLRLVVSIQVHWLVMNIFVYVPELEACDTTRAKFFLEQKYFNNSAFYNFSVR
jgi:hypothetical protein